MTASAELPARPSRLRITLGCAPAARTASASRVDQIRSSARIVMLRTAAGAGLEGASVKAGGEVPEHVPRRHDARRLPAIDDRNVPEATDRHLVNRHGD